MINKKQNFHFFYLKDEHLQEKRLHTKKKAISTKFY
jgi:hypothetical protein